MKLGEKEKESLLQYYCKNDMKKLIELSQKVLVKIGRHNESELEDFYSIANEELWRAILSYDPGNIYKAKFETYLFAILERKFKSEISKRNRSKRTNGLANISLDKEIEDSDGVCLVDLLESSANVENEAIENVSGNLDIYLKQLSPRQLEFAQLIMQDYTIDEARQKLKLSKTRMESMLKHMRSYEKKKALYINKRENKIAMGNTMITTTTTTTTTMEKSKRDIIRIDNLIKKMNDKVIIFDHSLQRYAGQWSNKMKSDLISDILQGNPIPALIFAEQFINNTPYIFDLDGKQRCTTAKEFAEDAFKISKNVSRSIIKYMHHVKDEDGNVVTDERGLGIVEWREFDIRNKKFSQLPDQLQDVFLTYCFEYTLYLNCSDEDIAYHIQRYNQGKAMNSAQKGVTHLGTDFAREVKAITGMPLFQDNNFTFKQFNNGTIDRVVIETVMANNFIEDWKKNPEEMSGFLNKNASISMFEEVEDDIFKLQESISDEVGELFDAKNTFLWLNIFHRMQKSNLDEKDFNDFMAAFKNDLQFKEINGESFVNIDKGKNTKDKSMIMKKINHIEILIHDYFFENNLAS